MSGAAVVVAISRHEEGKEGREGRKEIAFFFFFWLEPLHACNVYVYLCLYVFRFIRANWTLPAFWGFSPFFLDPIKYARM